MITGGEKIFSGFFVVSGLPAEVSMEAGQPNVANGHKAEENQVSKTSSAPSSGILCPHQICLDMHQSLMLLIQSKYIFSHRLSLNFISPF